jgi:hypothetical protein
MKSKTNQLTLIYIITASSWLSFFTIVPKVFSYSGLPVLYFLKDLFVFFTGITFRYIYPLTIKERVILKNSRKIMTKSRVKWKYDIVAKATSDTIWDWKIQEDDLF